MVKKYIDFDGVIKDTYMPLFEDYLYLKSIGYDVDDLTHVINKNWSHVLDNSPIMNDAIGIINSLDNAYVCTRIHSLENEGVAKVKDLRRLGLKCDIILVPYLLKKTDMVSAKGNILVDDAVFNLDEWREAGGIPIFFDNRGTNKDGFGVENKNYVKTRTLEILKKY